MRVLFVTINSISYIPVMRYIISYISKKNDIQLIECYIKGNYKFENTSTIYLKEFNTIKEFNNQNIIFKFQKYIVSFYKIIRFILGNEKKVIYVIDFELLLFAILIRNIFFLRKVKIIYHQFEVVNFKSVFSKLLKFFNLDILIFPEINRAKFFITKTKSNTKTIIFPNTCNINSINKSNKVFDFEEKIGLRKVIGHIGNIGSDHFIDVLIKTIQIADESKYFFLLIGNYDNSVLKIFNQFKYKNNVKILDSVPHSELPDIYNIIDFGLILYKPLDFNYDCCAPNKLYEYWSFGIPVYAHKLKGLLTLFEKEEKGALFNFYDNDIPEKILNVINNYKDNKLLKIEFSKHYSIEYYLPIFDELFENEAK